MEQDLRKKLVDIENRHSSLVKEKASLMSRVTVNIDNVTDKMDDLKIRYETTTPCLPGLQAFEMMFHERIKCS